ncbi:MAG: hypothetical protein AAF456_03425 [Planctomycetota bacterium]
MNIVFCATVMASLFCSDPPQYTVSEKVDLVEINHYSDSRGNGVLDQAIYYQWSVEHGRFQVVDYKLLKSTAQEPVRDSSGDYFSVWHDGHVLRIVQAHSCEQTWTQFDPEHREREKLPHELRQGLAEVPRPASKQQR